MLDKERLGYNTIMKGLISLIIMSLALVSANGDLEDFASALMTAVTSQKSFNYDLSGVAKVTKMGGSYLYSGSLFCKDPQALIEKPEDLFPKFQRLAVTGYTFRAVEVLTFTSTSKLPLPAWRVQVKYTAAGL
ncbi:14kDa protein [Abisko virus]|uniref:14kDa protein n=1 Tax=Abisko virus TaxID=2025595 RepID=UPI000B9A14F1|nr:14kDa protein [Abisko virus]AST13107.1 14kDa protein [Abisko virus]